MYYKKGMLAKLLDFSLLIMAITYFAGFISFYPESLFLKKAPYYISHKYEFHFEVLLWIFFATLVFDLYLKYKKLNSWKLFFKKYWHEFIMVVLMPSFAAFKVAKIFIKLVKTLKALSSGLKVFYKSKKVLK